MCILQFLVMVIFIPSNACNDVMVDNWAYADTAFLHTITRRITFGKPYAEHSV